MISDGPVFIDANILVYFRNVNDLRKQVIAQNWIRQLADSHLGRISTQVLVEFYAVAARSEKQLLSSQQAQADIEAFSTWQPIQPSIELFRCAWDLTDKYSLSWWDAMIVAAALISGCRTLLSEDMQDGLVINNTLTIVNPFAL